MKPFNPDEYYSLGKDPFILDELRNDYLTIHAKGIYLIADYYKDKYQSSIIFPSVTKLYNLFKEELNFEGNLEEFISSYYPDIRFTNIDDFVSAIAVFIGELRSNEANARVAFYIGSEDAHAIPIIYIKENNEDILLFADSKGAKEQIINSLLENSPIPVYVVTDIRQVDRYSCYADALVFAKDATAKESNSNDYCIKNLLAELKSRRAVTILGDKEYYQVKLPNALLKSAQFQKFIVFHMERNSSPINQKNETLEVFHERYQDKDVLYLDKDGQTPRKGNFNAYIRKKGFKYAHIIEIQFYLQQIKKELSHLAGWDDSYQSEYIRDAKAYLAAEKDLYSFSKAFLDEKKSNIRNNELDIRLRRPQK